MRYARTTLTAWQRDCAGPEAILLSERDKCQYTCLDVDAYGASDPGDLQCNLGAHIRVETGSPCDGTDVLLELGAVCMPVSTQRASAAIIDANFIAASTVPPTPNINDLSGTPIPCGDLDASSMTGLQTVGVANVFGTALDDLSLGLLVTCQ